MIVRWPKMVRPASGLLLCVLLLFAVWFDLSDGWRYDRVPRLYGDKVPTKAISPRLRKVQRRIVMLHDSYRTKVIPPAANMLNMKWHHGAARSAQKWANQCRVLTHDTPKGRWIDNFGACGQNIFVSTHRVPWMFALRTWFLERQNFTYGSSRNVLDIVGHYTQMVWAATHKVGCGLTKCPKGGPRGKPFYNYVCNYCPIGNHEEKLGIPYKRGRPCGSCQPNCLSRKIRLCTNSCNTADLWANCRDLYRTWPGWLCNTATSEGLERQRNCAATCTCHGKIHD
ncbi:cysteine-rich venom protein-like [Anopheles marshallii]|uniref:cysteine-rich venom protein-like n=1 Tax=Anopheles marshallii TaxID=1521116 RepID=UPI00237A31F1|nr:cysteine-rich venom protein-like [Anopheles marshallii]